MKQKRSEFRLIFEVLKSHIFALFFRFIFFAKFLHYFYREIFAIFLHFVAKFSQFCELTKCENKAKWSRKMRNFRKTLCFFSLETLSLIRQKVKEYTMESEMPPFKLLSLSHKFKLSNPFIFAN